MAKKILIKNGRVIDPANKIDEIRDVLIENGKIADCRNAINRVSTSADQIIDASGKIVMPGIVDMHVHLREPGREDKETIASATKAALRGGVTSVLAMPNTTPAIDSIENIELLKSAIKNTADANVFICGAITKGRLGKEPADIAGLKSKGAVAVSDDGVSCDDDYIFLEALNQARKTGILVICHCEDRALTNNGVVNFGFTSTRMGLRGITKESEYKRVERDILLAVKAKADIHIAHVSCAESIDIIAKAKKKGVKITAEVTPHHLSLTEEAVLDYGPNFKMNPPLRSKADLAAIKQALKDGTIDVIASDHAPHTENEKEIEFDRAEFGVIGLETELPVAITELVSTNLLSFSQLVEKMCLNPAKILGINKGTLSAGAEADIVIVSPDEEWVVKKEEIVSKSKNSPFVGRKLKGVVEYTICSGKVYANTSLRG